MLDGTGAWLIDGDLRDPSSLTAALDGTATVLHLAGLVRVQDEALLQAVHVEGTRNLVEAVQAAGTRRIVALSSDTVNRRSGDAYAHSKAEAERVLLEGSEAGILECILLRPPMILGPHSPHLASLRKAARLPILPLPAGAAKRSPVFVEDVARALLAAAELKPEDLPQAPIDLVGRDSVDFGELVVRVAQAAARRPPRVLRVPQGLLASGSELALKLGLPAPFTRERLAGMAESPPTDDGEARRVLAWDPLPLDEVLSRSLGTS